MSRKRKKGKIEFRYYDIPKDELVLPLLGNEWVRPYGEGIKDLHFHNYMEIGICHFGEGKMYLQNLGECDFTAGSIAIIPPSILHTTISKNYELAFWEWLYFDIPGVLEEMQYLKTRRVGIQEIESIIQQQEIFFHQDEYPRMAAVIKEIRDESDSKDILYKEKIKSLLQSFVIELFRIKNIEQERNKSDVKLNVIAPALTYVEKNYREEIKISALANACNMSESNFRRIFSDYMNMTPNSYVNVVRIRNACKMLKEGNASVNEISYLTGFADVSTFHRNFKKMLGTTPHQWKKSLGQYENKKQYFNISALKGW